MSTRTQAFIMLLFGVALVRLATSELLLRFVRAYARLPVLIAGGLMAALAVWSLVVSARRDAGQAEAGSADDDHGGGHGHGAATRTAWLVLAPVVAILVIGPPALGAFTANRQTGVVSAGAATQHFGGLRGQAPYRLGLFEFATRAVNGAGATLAGRTVRLTGFVAHGSAGDFTLARLIITCCAADASPIFVRVIGSADGAEVRANEWVTVTGTYAGVDATDRDVPVLRASTVSATAMPANPYD